MPRQCPFPGCVEQIPSQRFACRDHWFALNHAQRSRITRAWRAYQLGGLSLDGLKAVQAKVLTEIREGSR